MIELAELRERMTQLEARMDDVHDLARGTDQEVSGWRGAFNNHTKTLNAIRKDQNEHGQRLARVEAELAEVRSEMGHGFAEVRSEMGHGFGLLANGQALITGLLTRHLDEPAEETSTGDADE